MFFRQCPSDSEVLARSRTNRPGIFLCHVNELVRRLFNFLRRHSVEFRQCVQPHAPDKRGIRIIPNPLAGLRQQFFVIRSPGFYGSIIARGRMVFQPFAQRSGGPGVGITGLAFIFRPLGVLQIVGELVALFKCVIPLALVLQMESADSRDVLFHFLP